MYTAIGVLSALIFFGFLIIKILKQKKETPQAVENPPQANNHHPTPNSSHDHHEEEKSSIWMKIIKTLIIIIFIIIILISVAFAFDYVISKIGKHFEEKKYITEWVQDGDPILIHFNGKFETSENVPIPNYRRFEFVGATEPFCVKNSAGEMACGEKGSNPNMGSSSSNDVLYFQSQNGKDAKIWIVLLKKIKKEVK
jgi:hypothetical protein